LRATRATGESNQSSSRLTDIFRLLLLTAGAFAIQGYHPAVEDAEIYLPQIQKLLHPSLFPFGAEFFESHARLTLFPNLIADSVRFTHAPLGWVLIGWQLLSIFLLLLACWKLSGICFEDRRARWAGVTLVAALLTIPVGGTALYITDEYLNPRSLALFAAVFAVDAALRKKYGRVILWTAFAAVIHPLMSVFGLSLIVVIVWLRDLGGFAFLRRGEGSKIAAGAAALMLPLGISFRRPSPAYQEIIHMRPYFFILRWHWYEWLGIFAPLALIWWVGRRARRRGRAPLDLLCTALVIYGLVYFALALVMTIPPQLLALVRYQPMRSLQLLYVLMFLLLGGWLGETILRKRIARWIALFLPLSFGMYFVQGQIFPSTPHFEWPGHVPQNDWLQAFAWIRANTPENAVFALNPRHMDMPGEDEHGFRASTERSMLADAVKDSGAATMFPDLPLAEHWEAQMKAEDGWEHFHPDDFARLERDWRVSWVVLDQPGLTLPDCPYANRTLRVCKLK
jgi:hypothetical protein